MIHSNHTSKTALTNEKGGLRSKTLLLSGIALLVAALMFVVPAAAVDIDVSTDPCTGPSDAEYASGDIGAVAAPVAKIGTTEYASLDEAIKAVSFVHNNHDTYIVLLQDVVSGAIDYNSGLGFDLNGHSLTLTSMNIVGDVRCILTEGSVLNIEKFASAGTGNMLMFMDALPGTQTVFGGVGNVDGLTVTAAADTFKLSGNAVKNAHPVTAEFSLSYGNFAVDEGSVLEVSKDVPLVVNSGEKAFSLDVKGTMNVKSDVKIDNSAAAGNVSIASTGVLTVNSLVLGENMAVVNNGAMNGDFAGIVAPVTGNGTINGKQFGPLAKIGDVTYDSLSEAFNAATEGATIILLKDVILDNERIDCSKGVTFDGNNHKITVVKLPASTDPNKVNMRALWFTGDNTTIKNLTIDGKGNYVLAFNTGSASIDNLTLSGVDIIGADGTAIDFNGCKNVNLSDVTVKVSGNMKKSAVLDNVNGMRFTNCDLDVISIHNFWGPIVGVDLNNSGAETVIVEDRTIEGYNNAGNQAAEPTPGAWKIFDNKGDLTVADGSLILPADYAGVSDESATRAYKVVFELVIDEFTDKFGIIEKGSIIIDGSKNNAVVDYTDLVGTKPIVFRYNADHPVITVNVKGTWTAPNGGVNAVNFFTIESGANVKFVLAPGAKICGVDTAVGNGILFVNKGILSIEGGEVSAINPQGRVIKSFGDLTLNNVTVSAVNKNSNGCGTIDIQKGKAVIENSKILMDDSVSSGKALAMFISTKNATEVVFKGADTVTSLGNTNNGAWKATVAVGAKLTCDKIVGNADIAYLFSVTVDDAVNGTVSASTEIAKENDSIIVTVTADTGFRLSSLIVNGADVTDKVADGKYTFPMPKQDVKVTAQFDAINYQVSFDVQGHGNAVDAQTVAFNGKAVKPADPVAEGFIFGGWYTDKACAVVYDFNTVVTESVTLYAKWTAITYDVEFDVQGHGAAVDAQTVAYNGKVVKPADLTETGYEFGGWYTDKACTSAWNFSTVVTESMTLYAKWTVIEYSVNVGDNVTVDPVKAAFGTEVTVKVTVPEHKKLVSLTYTVEGAEPVDIENGKFTMPAADVTVIAVFENIQYVIDVDENIVGGTVDPLGIMATMGSEITVDVIADPGYKLVSLFYTMGDKKVIINDFEFVMPGADIVVSAVFEQIVDVDAETDKDGNVTQDTVDRIIDDLETIKERDPAAVPEVNIDSAKNEQAVIPADLLNAVKDNGAVISVTTSYGSVSITAEALSTVEIPADAKISMSVKESEIPESHLTFAKGCPVFELSLKVNGQSFTSEFGESVTVSVPYELNAGDKAGDIEVYYLADDGTVVKMDNVTYENGVVSFDTPHFSTYTIKTDSRDPLMFIGVLVAVLIVAGVVSYALKLRGSKN